MPVSAITLNGVPFTPSDIQVEHDRIGTSIQAANGTRRWAHRADKRRWTISWATVPLATLTAVRTVFALTSVFAYADEYGTAFVVFCEAGALRSNVVAMPVEGGAQVLYYDVELTITEA